MVYVHLLYPHLCLQSLPMLQTLLPTPIISHDLQHKVWTLYILAPVSVASLIPFLTLHNVSILPSHPEQIILFKASVLFTYHILLWQLPSLSLILSTLFILYTLLCNHLMSETILLEFEGPKKTVLGLLTMKPYWKLYCHCIESTNQFGFF